MHLKSYEGPRLEIVMDNDHVVAYKLIAIAMIPVFRFAAYACS